MGLVLFLKDRVWVCDQFIYGSIRSQTLIQAGTTYSLTANPPSVRGGKQCDMGTGPRSISSHTLKDYMDAARAVMINREILVV